VQVFGFSAVHLQWYQISSPGPWGRAPGADAGQPDGNGEKAGEGET